MIITVFSAIAGIVIGGYLVLPRLGSRKEAFVAVGVGVATLIGLFLAMYVVGPATKVVIVALVTMISACAMGILREAICGFRQDNYS